MGTTAVGPETVEQWAVTELKQETFAFLWSIKNYPTISSNGGDMKSPVFQGGLKSGHQWQIEISPKKVIDGTEHFSIYLRLNKFGDGDSEVGRKIKVRFQFSLLSSTGLSLHRGGGNEIPGDEFEEGRSWGWDKFLATSVMISPSSRYVHDDTLTIHCRIWIEGELAHRAGQGGAPLDEDGTPAAKRQRLEVLTNHLHDLLLDGQFADVSVSTSTKTFKAHKNILSARSTVFRTMLSTPMLESITNIIEIPDFDEHVVKAMLEYIYTGEIGDLHEIGVDMMRISDKYDLGELKKACELSVSANLTVEDAANALVLAHLHNATTLKGKVTEFINRNMDAVKKTKSFEDVLKSHPTLFVDLYLCQ